MNDQATYVTKNQRMCEAIQKGNLETLICPDVSARDKTVEFRMPDGKIVSREFDVIVRATGYTAQFPWLKVKEFDSNPRSWFLHCFPEKFGHCLSFVGYARPHQGGIPPMAEMQARYVAMILAGNRKLPRNYALQARQQRENEREYYHISPYLHILVDYSAYIESVARRVGCEPRMPLWSVLLVNLHLLAVALMAVGVIRSDLNPLGFQGALSLWLGTIVAGLAIDDALLAKWWFYPGWNVWYRQRGPGAKPEVLRNTLARVPFWQSTAVTKGFILLLFWSFPTYYAQRLISPFIFCVHAVAELLQLRWAKRWGGFLRPKMFALHGTQWRISDLFTP
jgi:dimethylaniline monooxygenase (N-oxide forming)